LSSRNEFERENKRNRKRSSIVLKAFCFFSEAANRFVFTVERETLLRQSFSISPDH